MPRYKVFLREVPEPIVIVADDMNVVSTDGPTTGAYLNFWKADEGENDVTVAAVEFGEFRYVIAD